jgi:hypothetical protein
LTRFGVPFKLLADSQLLLVVAAVTQAMMQL